MNLAQNEIRKILCSSQFTFPIPPESHKKISLARTLNKYLEIRTSRWTRSEGRTVPAAFAWNWTSDHSISTFCALAVFHQSICSQTLKPFRFLRCFISIQRETLFIRCNPGLSYSFKAFSYAKIILL